MRWRLRRFFYTLLVLAVIVLVAFLMLRSRYREIVTELAETQVKNATSDLTNDAIAKQIANGTIQYDRIVYFEKNLDGRITALKTNMSEINHLKTDILNIINDEILALDTADIGIPLGSLFLPEFFSGKGPAIPVHILSIRNSDATFESNFSQAGINQTLHQLNMIVSVDVSVLVMGETDSFTIHSEVVVAETVIIGDVPSTYLQTGGYYGFQRENRPADRSAEGSGIPLLRSGRPDHGGLRIRPALPGAGGAGKRPPGAGAGGFSHETGGRGSVEPV